MYRYIKVSNEPTELSAALFKYLLDGVARTVKIGLTSKKITQIVYSCKQKISLVILPSFLERIASTL